MPKSVGRRRNKQAKTITLRRNDGFDGIGVGKKRDFEAIDATSIRNTGEYLSKSTNIYDGNIN